MAKRLKDYLTTNSILLSVWFQA